MKVVGICFCVDAAHPPGGWDHHIPQVVLEVPGEKELRAVTEKLTEAGVQVRECSVKKSLVFIRACPYIRAFWQNRPYFARIFVILPVFL